MKVYPIVEGHGEVAAVPVLLRRLLTEAQCYDLQVAPPIRRTQAQLHSKEGIQTAVELAFLDRECVAVVILFDGEDFCPVELGAKVRAWAQETARGRPCDVVIAYREYETWFMASLESLRGKYGIRNDAETPADPESRRDAKGWLEEFMPTTRAYSETGDQPGMSATFDMRAAYGRNRSFRKMVKVVGELVGQVCKTAAWTPEGWDVQQ